MIKQKKRAHRVLAVEQYEIENTYRQEKDEKLLKFLVLFLDKHCFCVHRSYFDFVDMPSLCSARYICLAANSICFAMLKLDMI